ncbi:hypothetical protein MAHJHV59_47160 [Mycobacterium avium subsp. hominissuis]
MSVATAFNGGAPPDPICAGGDAVTLVEGGTFCLSNRHVAVPVGQAERSTLDQGHGVAAGPDLRRRACDFRQKAPA